MLEQEEIHSPEPDDISSDAGFDSVDHDQPTEQRQSEAAAFLDTLSDDSEPSQADSLAEDPRPRDEHGRFIPNQDAVQPAPEDKTAKAPEGQDKEYADILDGIKSERGRGRFQVLISDLNKEKAKAKELDQSMAEVRTVLESAGMDAAQFAQHIEFSRLANSQDPQNLRIAAQMIEQVRTDIYKRLGQDAPGVDVLADFPDLAQRVQNFELDRQAALELAQYRRQQQQAQAMQQQQLQASHEQQQQAQQLQSAMAQVESYLNTRAREVDHQPRMEVLSKHFKDPKNIQEFVRTYRPDQMPMAIRWMYDNVQVAPRSPAPSPIRARPSVLGVPVGRPGDEPAQKVASILDAMGI